MTLTTPAPRTTLACNQRKNPCAAPYPTESVSAAQLGSKSCKNSISIRSCCNAICSRILYICIARSLIIAILAIHSPTQLGFPPNSPHDVLICSQKALRRVNALFLGTSQKDFVPLAAPAPLTTIALKMRSVASCHPVQPPSV